MRSFASEEAARIVILNSRNSFVPLIALCTYAIAITEGRSGALEPRYRSLEWIRVLVERHNTDSVWLDDLSSSHFMSIRTLRAGVYINWETFNSPHILQLYLNYGVPVWIRMPVDPTDMKLQSSIRLTRTQVSALLKSRQQQQQQQQPVPMYYPTSTETISTTSSNDPPSRQRPGESALEFITRNISANDRAAFTESETAYVARLDRERQAAQFRCPGRNGPLVFEWVDSVQTYVPRAQVPEKWDMYANSQKWYNGHRNEWDLCTELDPFAIVDSSEYGDDDDDDIDDIPQPSISGPVPSLTASKDISALSREAVEDSYSNTSPSHSSVTTPEQELLLFHRYGFHPDTSTIEYALPTVVFDEKKAARALAETELTIAAYRQSAIHFISFLASENAYVPAPLRDLDINNSTSLYSHMSRSFVFQIISDHEFQITCVDTPSDVLLVPYPSQVVELLRLSNCNNLQALALYFATQGSWFHIGRPLHNLSPFGVPEGANCGLGFRRHNFQASWVDYQAYVDRRNNLLKDPSIVRAPLMKGGIIWRITIDSIYDNYGAIDLTNYFTNEVEEIELTKSDLGVIVGLYLVWTGKFFFYLIFR